MASTRKVDIVTASGVADAPLLPAVVKNPGGQSKEGNGGGTMQKLDEDCGKKLIYKINERWMRRARM